MSQTDDLLYVFLEEIQGHLPAIELGLLELEKDPQNRKQLDPLFRIIHTIKGGAGLLNLKKVNDLAHIMENVLGLARSQKIVFEKEHIDALLAGYDCLLQMLKDPVRSETVDIRLETQMLEALYDPKQAKEIPLPSSTSSLQKTRSFFYEGYLFLNKDLPRLETNFSAYLEEIEQSGHILEAHLSIENKQIQDDHSQTGDICYIFSYQTSLTLEQVSEVLKLPLTQIHPISAEDIQEQEHPLTENPPSQVVKEKQTKKNGERALQAEPKELLGGGEDSELELPSFTDLSHDMNETIRVYVKRLNRLLDLAGELVLVRNQIFRLEKSLGFSKMGGFKGILQNFNRITTELQEVVMSTRMQAVGIVFSKTPRLIRKLNAKLGKKIDVITEGGEVELDKSMIEALTDPMTHIIRNVVDHGMEPPEERIKKGKLPNGTLLQKAFYKGESVVVQVSDDGRGIDPELILSKAIEKNFVSPQEAQKMTDQEKINLIFIPGFSSANTISSISGRGVGMDVVKNNVEGIGGTIEVYSILGKGTTLTITLPLTMAIIPCLIAQNQNAWFAFPQINVEEMLLLEEEDYAKSISKVQNHYVLRLRGKLLPLISLEKGLNPSSSTSHEDSIFDRITQQKLLNLFIIKSEKHRAAVIVDKIIGNEEIVVKPLSEYIKQIKSFSGTTILGDGSIAMIINVLGLMENIHIGRLEEKIQKSASEEKVIHQYEKESLLIFDNGSSERFALPIPLIRRVDSIPVEDIQRIGTREYIEYREEQVRLIRLEEYLPIQKPSCFSGNVHVIFPKNTKVPVAFLIHKVLDSIDLVVKLERVKIAEHRILGSFLVDRKVILLLDMYAILEEAEPDCVSTRGLISSEKAQKHHLLLVEDTPFFMKVVKDYLIHLGYTVSTAINGREALDKLREEAFDLVLTDIEMPVMNGKELLKSIRANPNWGNLPVIALTSLSGEEMILAGKKMGFNEWLVKLNKEQLLQTLQKYL